MTPNRVFVGVTVFLTGIMGYFFGYVNSPFGMVLIAAFAIISPIAWNIK